MVDLVQGGRGLLLVRPVPGPHGTGVIGLLTQVVRPEYVARASLAARESAVAVFAHNESGSRGLLLWNGGNRTVGSYASVQQLRELNNSVALVQCANVTIEQQVWSVCEVRLLADGFVVKYTPLGLFLTVLFIIGMLIELVILLIFCSYQKHNERLDAQERLQEAKEASFLNLGHEVRHCSWLGIFHMASSRSCALR